MKLILRKDDGTEFLFDLDNGMQRKMPGWKITEYKGTNPEDSQNIQCQFKVFRKVEEERQPGQPAVTNEDLEYDEYRERLEEIETSTTFSWVQGEFIPAMAKRVRDNAPLTPGMKAAIDKVYNTKYKSPRR